VTSTPTLWGAVAIAATLLVGCASRNLVVVLPESDGHVGAVMVRPGQNETVLDKAYLAAHPRSGAGRIKAFTISPARVNRIFGPTLAALPQAPKTYDLYFQNDSVELQEGSRASFEQVFADIAARPAAEIVITGFTDTVGSADDNDRLSLERAKAVSELFVQRGVPRESIVTAGRGSRELARPTGDNVAEPLNRRVVITVR